MLSVVDFVPGNAEPFTPDASFAFTITDDVFYNSVVISLDDVVVYENETGKLGYFIERTVPANGVRYTVSAAEPWAYNRLLRIGLFAQIVGLDVNTFSWTLRVTEDASCFTGPINTFEESLLFPFTTVTLRRTEELRAFLLDNAISRPQANRAVRWLLLRAHNSALACVLRDLVATPTIPERQARLCAQRTDYALDQSLRGKADILPQVITELQSVGLPANHAQLCLSYDRDDPNLRIPLACVLVCLAKALEVNAIT